MRRIHAICRTAFVVLTVSAIRANSQAEEPLRWVQTLPMPNVKGRLDHMDADVKGKRLFVAGLENGSLEAASPVAADFLADQETSEPIYLNDVLEETCALVAPRAQAKGIMIDLQPKPEVATLGDEAFLRQLFLIFLENAIKYSPANTRVQVNMEKADGLVRVGIENQGVGISREHLPHIFERFYRAAPAGRDETGEAPSGGLGLAIAQAIARRPRRLDRMQQHPRRGLHLYR